MRLYSFNVNGYRAIARKPEFGQWLGNCGADVVCLQETKAEPDQVPKEWREPFGYKSVWNPARVKRGWSGTACLHKGGVVGVDTGLPDQGLQGEGRLIHLEFEAFHLLNCYFPNGQRDEIRLAYKLDYYDAFLDHAEGLRASKPVVVCGDFNTAHTPKDIARPEANENRSGFLPVERAWMDRFVRAGFVDTLRMFVSDAGRYSWWSFRAGARERNVGWRLDYFFVSEEFSDRVRAAWIEDQVRGSDHAPVGLELDV